jgi:hypothetical protein
MPPLGWRLANPLMLAQPVNLPPQQLSAFPAGQQNPYSSLANRTGLTSQITPKLVLFGEHGIGISSMSGLGWLGQNPLKVDKLYGWMLMRSVGSGAIGGLTVTAAGGNRNRAKAHPSPGEESWR